MNSLIKTFIILSLLFPACAAIAADNCPSVEDVKKGDFRGWQLMHKILPATSEQITEFMDKTFSFSLVRWVPFKDAPLAMCKYYPTKDFTLIKQNLPKPVGNQWHSQFLDNLNVTVYGCSFDTVNCSL